MSVIEKPFLETAVQRSEWLIAVDDLFSDVETWSREWLRGYDWTPAYGWDVMRQDKEIQDDFVKDRYQVSILEINNARPHALQMAREEKLVLEPIGFNPLSGTGRVDFYAWPAMYRLRLLYTVGNTQWIIKTDSGVDWPLPWSEDTFVQLAEGLLNA